MSLMPVNYGSANQTAKFLLSNNLTSPLNTLGYGPSNPFKPPLW